MYAKQTIVMCAAVLLSTSAFAQNRSTEQPWLSIPQVHARLEAAGYRNIEKIEREGGSYEAKAIAPNGERIKIYLHPQTGEIIGQKYKGRDERYGGQAAPGNAPDRRAAAECNKRRCRDDLPPSTTPPAATK